MLELNVLEILKEKGKTKYWLFKKFDMSNYGNFNDMITNKTKSIKYESIEKFLDILECEPNKLFVKKEK